MKYSCNDLAIIIPTRNRPEKISNFLESLLKQKNTCNRILVVASGESVEDIVMSFSENLPVEYYHSKISGQLNQRAIAIEKLHSSTSLVAIFDDDIELEQNALDEMISFWNNIESDTAGVAFNVINNPQHKCSFIQKILYHSVPEKGKVLRSGMSTLSSPTNEDLKTEWLCGGATVWRLDILKNFSHRKITAKWAIAEDLIYSYPIGKIFPLYVSSKSCVRHEHVFDYSVKSKDYYYGKTQTLWTFYFVESNDDLSRLLFIFVTITKIIGKIFVGALTIDNSKIKFAIGQFQGLLSGLIALIRGEDLEGLLDEEPVS